MLKMKWNEDINFPPGFSFHYNSNLISSLLKLPARKLGCKCCCTIDIKMISPLRFHLERLLVNVSVYIPCEYKYLYVWFLVVFYLPDYYDKIMMIHLHPPRAPSKPPHLSLTIRFYATTITPTTTHSTHFNLSPLDLVTLSTFLPSFRSRPISFFSNLSGMIIRLSQSTGKILRMHYIYIYA